MPSSAFCLYALPPSTSVFLRPRVEGDSEVASVCSFLQPLSHDKGAAGEPWRGGGGPRKARAAVGVGGGGDQCPVVERSSPDPWDGGVRACQSSLGTGIPK